MLKYKKLVKILSKLCPKASIILSEIPLRSHHRRGAHPSDFKIKILNKSLKVWASYGDRLTFMEAAPKEDLMYRRDGFHFNENGTMEYALSVLKFINNPSNFLSQQANAAG